MKPREIIFIGLTVIFAYLWWTKKVEVVERTITKTDTIYKRVPISIQITSEPISIENVIRPTEVVVNNNTIIQVPQGAKKYTYRDSIPNGFIRETIFADTIYGRIFQYNVIDEVKEIQTTIKEVQFDNRLMLGAFVNFDHTTPNPMLSVSSWSFGGSGLELLYVRNKVYYGISYGLTQNRFDYEWARNGVLDGQVGFKFGIKIK